MASVRDSRSSKTLNACLGFSAMASSAVGWVMGNTISRTIPRLCNGGRRVATIRADFFRDHSFGSGT